MNLEVYFWSLVFFDSEWSYKKYSGSVIWSSKLQQATLKHFYHKQAKVRVQLSSC